MNLLQSFISSIRPSETAAAAVRSYFEWQRQHYRVDFIPTADDDVDLRTYLHDLHTKGASQVELEEQAEALKQFYGWAQAEGVIEQNPFDEQDFTPAMLARDEVEERRAPLAGDREEDELERLRGLRQIAEQLNSTLDIQSAINNALLTLLKVMGLQTGWVSMLAETHLTITPPVDAPPHGFQLAAACGLPLSLARHNRRLLCQPPACRCQRLLRNGRLTRAVNIVQCSRLQKSSSSPGSNHDLRYHASVPLVSQGKPLGIINVASAEWQSFTDADLHFLSAVSAQLVITLERAYFYENAEARRILSENELKIAREVQAGLMPREMPEIPGYCLAGAWRPAFGVAGDFYHIFPLDKGRWGIAIGDVAGKGTAAALHMATVHSLIISAALRNRSPAAVLEEVNQMLLRQYSPVIFVTVFLAVLEPKTRTLAYVNAGHNPPLVRRASGAIEPLTRTGSVVGVLDEPQLSEAKITLEPGDAVVMYTDGVTEAWHPQLSDEDYGINRLTAAVTAAPGTAGQLLAHVEADLKTFTADAPPQDDIALLVLSKD